MSFEISDDRGYRLHSTESDSIVVNVNGTNVRIYQDGTVTISREE